MRPLRRLVDAPREVMRSGTFRTCIRGGDPGPVIPARGGVTAAPRAAHATRSLVLRVALLLDQLRAEQQVQLLLDRGAAVVGAVDRAGELDELGVEGARRLLLADPVFDVPELR